MKSFVAFLLALFLSSAAAQELVATPALPEQVEVDTNNLRGRELCSPSISITGLCWGLGQTVTANLNSCPTPYAEWVGIFPAGTMDFSAAFAWKYVCGSQSCATAAPAGPKFISFGYESSGSTSWPIMPGMMYQMWFHTAQGSIPSSPFQVTAGFSCGPPAPIAPGSRGPTLRF